MKKALISLLVVLFIPIVTHADTFSMDQTNLLGLTGGPWATVSLTESGGGIHFEVDPLESAFTSIGSNFGLQSFYFNENTSFGSDFYIMNNPTGWNWQYSSPGSENAGGGFGIFEFITSGTGDIRANPLSFDVFATGHQLSIEDLSTALSSEGYIFAAHIADFNDGQSAKFATNGQPVPEPSTLLLLGSGLVGLVGYGRRRMRK